MIFLFNMFRCNGFLVSVEVRPAPPSSANSVGGLRVFGRGLCSCDIVQLGSLSKPKRAARQSVAPPQERSLRFASHTNEAYNL